MATFSVKDYLLLTQRKSVAKSIELFFKKTKKLRDATMPLEKIINIFLR